MGNKRRLEVRLAKKAAAIEDLLYRNKNVIIVKEELTQYDYIFKLIIKKHKEHWKILKPEEQSNEEENWLKVAEE